MNYVLENVILKLLSEVQITLYEIYATSAINCTRVLYSIM